MRPEQLGGETFRESETRAPTATSGSQQEATVVAEEAQLEAEMHCVPLGEEERCGVDRDANAGCGAEEVERLFRLVAEGLLDKLSSTEVQQLQKLDENGYVLRHVLHREHSDAQTARVLKMMLLPAAEHKPDGHAVEVDFVSAALVEQLLKPYQSGERRPKFDEEMQIKCLCGLPVVDGVFACSREESGSSSAASENKSSRDHTRCRRIREVPLTALAHALCACCLQGKLRSLLLLERCCSIPAANDKLLRQGRGSLVHSAAIGGSRAILVRLVEMHGFSPRGIPDSRSHNEPIHLAACSGCSSAVLLLLQLGVPIETQDRFNKTAAYHAASNGHYILLRTLVDMGASLDVTDADGVSLFREVLRKSRIRDGRPRQAVLEFVKLHAPGQVAKISREDISIDSEGIDVA